jgi:hypothetical protein
MNTATDWMDQARGLLDMLKQSVATPADGRDAGHGGDCRWCPVCQAAAVVRGERPEVTAALADVLTATATALRSLAEADRPAAADAPEPEREDGRAHGPGDPSPVVQRIDIA